ncbi:MAG: hypothetical protein ACO3ZD_03595 [Cyanobium sp.]|jgi:hypothetical protein
MTARRLLVVPLLSPLLAVLLLAALNPRPQLAFRVLTWTTPQAPLGLWLGGAALGGAALSGAGTALALGRGQGAATGGRRRVTAPRSSRAWAGAGWEERPEDARFRTDEMPREPWEDLASEERRRGRDGPQRAPIPFVAPPRAPGEPAPTLDAPFRVLRRPSAGGAPPQREPEPVAVGVEDDWGRAAPGDDW